jgi:outer membrane protein assembly factor BamB
MEGLVLYRLFSIGHWRVVLFALTGSVLSIAAVAQPTITLSVSSGPPTTKFSVSGSGFAPNVGVDIYFDTTDEALVVTDSNGAFHNAGAHALGSSYPGKHWVTALERYGGQGTQDPFLVFTSWSQFHFDASRSGLNPYENVISKRTVGRLRLAWHATGIEALGSSPAVAEGLTYITGGGNLYALDALSGTLLWKYFGNDGTMQGSPAVADGIVYDQDGGGAIHAVNAKTGSLIWKERFFNTGGSSPAISNGVAYIAAANSQKAITTLYALDAKTGATIWTAPIGTYNADESPTPALGVDTVYAVTEGELFALDANSGKQLWTYTVGNMRGAYPAPCIANGVVYAGSFDHSIYALNGTTGALIWKYTTGGEVSSSPAFANGVIYVGSTSNDSADNSLYALNAITGALQWKSATGGPINSSPAIANGIVFDSSEDYNFHAWDADTGSLLWQYTTGNFYTTAPTVANGTVWLAGYNLYAFTVKPDVIAGSSASDLPPDMRALHPDETLLPYAPANR